MRHSPTHRAGAPMRPGGLPRAALAALAAAAVCTTPGLNAQTAPPAATAPAAVATVAPGAPSAASTSGPPLGFAQAFDAALAHDAQFRSARAEREMTRQNVPITRAALLPSLGFSASNQQVAGQRSFPNAVNQQVTLEVDYRVPNQSLQLRAPLFNWESTQRYRTALLQDDAAEALLRVRGIELVERFSVAYMQRLLADENIALLEAQTQLVRAQRERAAQRLERGEGTRIEVADLDAQLEVARVRMIEARDQLALARRSLARLTGYDAPQLRAVPAQFIAPPLTPLTLEEWVQLGLLRNPAVHTRERQVEIARASIQRAKAGHYPRLEAVASVTRGANDSVNNINQSNRLASVGLQLAIPIFSGFGVQAAVDQAGYELAKAEADLDNERENLRQELERHFVAATAARNKALALEQSASALEISLEGVRRGQVAGLRPLTDVIEAQTRVFSARRDAMQARFDYLLSRMRLTAQSGAPLGEVVMDVERLLQPQS